MTSETTPLLPRLDGDSKTPSKLGHWARRLLSVENRILFTGFLVTLSFSFTQVPLFYVFHLMTCEEYWKDRPPFEGSGDRCTQDAIASNTALQYSILGMSTTFCGTLNLLLTGWTVKKLGPRAALMIQTIVPAIRVATQILGVVAGGQAGMLIIQTTQLITIIGGPAGYILVVNIIVGEVCEPIMRTIVFGKLQGAIMLGQSIGFLTGGMIGDAWDIRAPFDTAFVAFCVSSIWVRFALPYISPEDMSSNKKAGGPSGFFAPLRVLVPQKVRLRDGRLKKHYGVIFLGLGIFVGVLATGYAPHLIQMYATAAFEFDQSDNGWLMSEFAFMRSVFLIFLFPPIIDLGRRFIAKAPVLPIGTRKHEGSTDREEGHEDSPLPANEAHNDEDDDALPTEPGNFDVSSLQGDTEPIKPVRSRSEEPNVYVFDLVFLRWSLVVDGALTTIAAFATKPWHIYLAAFLLPFGSGSAPAAKGVITEMAPESQRQDALNAVTLIENVARLATQGSFGFIFSALASVGKAKYTFFCNAAVAVIAMLVLLLSNFPEQGSKMVEEEEEEDDDADVQTAVAEEAEQEDLAPCGERS